jgi:hypothetical protein
MVAMMVLLEGLEPAPIAASMAIARPGTIDAAPALQAAAPAEDGDDAAFLPREE